MLNNPSPDLVVTDWQVIKAMSHRLRREILGLCWEHPRSVGELAGLLPANPGAVLYHVRRLLAVGLVTLDGTERKGGVIEKRYRAAARTVSFQPPATGITPETLAPVLASVSAAVREIAPGLVTEGRSLLVGHVVSTKIGSGAQRVVAERLEELAQYLAGLPEDPEGVPVTLAAAFGPQGERKGNV